MKKLFHLPQRGQSLVEFALVLPIFLLLAVVIFDLGRGVYYYSAIHNAAREGARYGVVHPNLSDYDDIKTKAINYAIGLGLNQTNVSVGNGPVEPVNDFDNPTIQVIVSYCFDPATPLVELFLSPEDKCDDEQQLYLESGAIMRMEALPTP
jgi:Flp pilus assembly protein TadG